ncbi:importin subunit alpha-1-like [Hibiscus syriacus]|uniref:importin subunit alpha-1-like n=1 Tax=Hibiscus syriacus TaxID=106335 RepID=UPI001922EB81|nr:importin subunit alpha-1-like [Hibiscus syriacus]
MSQCFSFLVSQGCIKPLCDLLNCRDLNIIKVCLEGLENIQKAGEADKTKGTTGRMNPYAQMISDAKDWNKMDHLLYHVDNEIRKKACKVFKFDWVQREIHRLALQRLWMEMMETY